MGKSAFKCLLCFLIFLSGFCTSFRAHARFSLEMDKYISWVLTPNSRWKFWGVFLTSYTAGIEIILSTMVRVASHFFFCVIDVQLGCWKLGQHFFVWRKGRRGHNPASQCQVTFCFSSCVVLSCRAPSKELFAYGVQWNSVKRVKVLALHWSRSMRKKENQAI